MSHDVHAVTGAFGYSGRHVAERLLARGARVRTLTGHPDRPDPFGGRVEVARLVDVVAALRSPQGCFIELPCAISGEGVLQFLRPQQATHLIDAKKLKI